MSGFNGAISISFDEKTGQIVIGGPERVVSLNSEEETAAAYAIHCSDSSISACEPVKYEEFFEHYKKYIQNFRNLTGASEPYTG